MISDLDRNNKEVTVNLNYPFILFLVFLVLKLTEVITWSWWWVTAPLWGGIALAVIILILVALIG